MRKYLLLACLLSATCLLSGCVFLVLGAGAAGGMAAVHDKVQLQYDTTFDRAWKETHATLDWMGIINSQDKTAGTIEATVQESHVIAQITVISENSMKIQIKARKNLLPDMDLARKIISDINNRLHLPS